MSTASPSLSPAALRPPSLRDACHLDELQRLHQHRGSHGTWNSIFALAHFIMRSVATFARSVLLAPSTLLLDPVSTILTLVAYPIMFFVLTIIAVAFVVGDLFGVQYIVHWLGRKWGGGYSIVNWLDPTLIDVSTVSIIRSAVPYLTGKNPTFVEPNVRTNTDPAAIRNFPLPLARAFLALSALVYERDDAPLKKASALPRSKRHDAEMLVDASEAFIKHRAAEWGLHFEGITDFKTVGGAFAGVFWGEGWIAVVFKGTSPSNFAEFLVDATISRIPASVFFGSGGGTAHEGFYRDLFPVIEQGQQDESDGYWSIVRHVKKVVEQINQNGQSPIQLWVTGHSLGSALASLFYARLLHAQGDVGPNVVVRDCFSYGTPRLGDDDFASAFEASTIDPLVLGKTLWRVVNNQDIVTMVPPGLSDDETNRGLLGPSILNYAHLGPAFHLLGPGFLNSRSGPKYDIVGGFHERTKVVVVDQGSWNTIERQSTGKYSSRWALVKKAGINPLRLAIGILPGPLYDHFPGAYYENIQIVQPFVATALKNHLSTF